MRCRKKLVKKLPAKELIARPQLLLRQELERLQEERAGASGVRQLQLTRHILRIHRRLEEHDDYARRDTARV